MVSEALGKFVYNLAFSDPQCTHVIAPRHDRMARARRRAADEGRGRGGSPPTDGPSDHRRRTKERKATTQAAAAHGVRAHGGRTGNGEARSASTYLGSRKGNIQASPLRGKSVANMSKIKSYGVFHPMHILAG